MVILYPEYIQPLAFARAPIACLQRADHFQRIRKSREKCNRAMAQHRRRLGRFMKVSQHGAGVGIFEKVDHRAMAAGDKNSVILIQARRNDIRNASWAFESSQAVAET